MADTLLSVVKEVLRATQQRSDKTAFSDTDDTNYIVDRVNDALDWIYDQNPTDIDTDGTITVTAATRKFNGPSGLDLHRIYDWSWRINDSEGDKPVNFTTVEFITTTYPLFEADEGDEIQHVYFDNGQVAVYPLLTTGASSLTLQFKYPAQFVKLTATTDTFPFEDRSQELKLIKKAAQFYYESHKSLGQPGVTLAEVEDLQAALIAKYAKTKRQGFVGYRQYGN